MWADVPLSAMLAILDVGGGGEEWRAWCWMASASPPPPCVLSVVARDLAAGLCGPCLYVGSDGLYHFSIEITLPAGRCARADFILDWRVQPGTELLATACIYTVVSHYYLYLCYTLKLPLVLNTVVLAGIIVFFFVSTLLLTGPYRRLSLRNVCN